MANLALSFKSQDVLIADLRSGALTVGLLIGAPAPDGSGITEPQGAAGYSRRPVTFGPTTRVGAQSVIKNNAPIIFGPTTVSAGWPTVTHLGLFDADGDLRATAVLGTSRTIPLGDSLAFADEAIQFRFS